MSHEGTLPVLGVTYAIPQVCGVGVKQMAREQEAELLPATPGLVFDIYRAQGAAQASATGQVPVDAKAAWLLKGAKLHKYAYANPHLAIYIDQQNKIHVIVDQHDLVTAVAAATAAYLKAAMHVALTEVYGVKNVGRRPLNENEMLLVAEREA